MVISVETLLLAYTNSYFPMADPLTNEILWYSPDPRAIIPFQNVKMPRSLRQFIKKNNIQFTIDKCFIDVITNCAKREDSWISEDIIESYYNLFLEDYAHSIETWKDGELVGGLYGVAIGGAFFGESMFNTISNAAKAAFYYLVDHLKERNFILIDTQFINDFTKSLGAIEIPKVQYLKLLKKALRINTHF